MCKYLKYRCRNSIHQIGKLLKQKNTSFSFNVSIWYMLLVLLTMPRYKYELLLKILRNMICHTIIGYFLFILSDSRCEKESLCNWIKNWTYTRQIGIHTMRNIWMLFFDNHINISGMSNVLGIIKLGINYLIYHHIMIMSCCISMNIFWHHLKS